MLQTVNAFIFDMDGVIFDSEKVYFDAFFMAADKNEVEATVDFVHQFSGKASQDCLDLLQNHLNNDREKTQQFFRDWGEARLRILAEQGLDFKDGFINLFEAIKQSGRDIGLVTSAYREDLEDNFSRNNNQFIDDFTHIITIDDVKYPKPDPQPYRMMIRHLGYTPQQCIVIEDSISGITAALAAQAKTIMINEHISPPETLEAQLLYRTEHHDDILAYLQNNGL